MASRKKHPSFDIPDAVRRAGQSGWVYRTRSHQPHAASGAARVPRAQGRKKPVVAATVPAVDAGHRDAPAAQEPVPSVATGLVGFGLHVAALPLVVPLFLTAAISRRLGLTGR